MMTSVVDDLSASEKSLSSLESGSFHENDSMSSRDSSSPTSFSLRKRASSTSLSTDLKEYLSVTTSSSEDDRNDLHKGSTQKQSRSSFLHARFKPSCLFMVLLLSLLHLYRAFMWEEIHPSSNEDRAQNPLRLRVNNNNNNNNSTFIKDSSGAKESSCDYANFWETALTQAKASLAESTDDFSNNTQELPPCPKVFVYNLSDEFSDTYAGNTSLSHAFGKVTLPGWRGHLRDTVQHHVGVIFEQRLHQPDNCYRTDDPTEADLFFVPMLLRRKKAGEWASDCQSINVTNLLKELVHLTPETECKHFFVFPKGHYSGAQCQGWFFDPQPRLSNAMRLAYSHTPGTADDDKLMYFTKASSHPEQDRLRYPNLMSVPYPSSLHWHGMNYQPRVSNNCSRDDDWNVTDVLDDGNVTDVLDDGNATSLVEDSDCGNMTDVGTKPWQMPSSRHNPDHRPYLMSYVGRFDHGDVPVRSLIQRQCESYQDPTKCHLPGSDILRRSSLPSQDILVKSRSVFCLEPAGDSPWRKGLADSITFGCIPVLFSDLSDDVTPWHWDDWKHRGRVLVDRDAFVDGRIDLYALLRSIPIELLHLMQKTIRRHARQYQYSLTDDPLDAFHLTMTKMKEETSRKVAQGQCGTVGAW